MFWKRERTVKVELTPPVTISLPTSVTQHVEEQKPLEKKTIDKDFSLKLLIATSVAMQAYLYITGYLTLTINYEKYGILISELELTNATILAEGYRQVLNTLTSWTDNHSITGSYLQLLPFLLISSILTYLIAGRGATWIAIGQKVLAGALALLLLFYLPIFVPLANLDTTKKPAIEQIISIENGKILSGETIAADTKYTLFRSDKIVYKIENSTGKILRKILLKEELIKENNKE